MKLLFDFFPIVLFFVAYKLYNIYVATAVIILASMMQVGWSWLRYRRVENMHLITLAFVIVLGGATLFLHDEMFIKWKPTVVNWIFALVFLGTQFIAKKPLVQRLMESQVPVTTEKVWGRLNTGWAVFFIFMGAINLYVAYHFSTDTWVNFKLFGMFGFTIVFVVLQSIYLMQYMVPEDQPPVEVSEKNSDNG
jgi:intracellular septation protein